MIIGTGVDITEVNRIKRASEKWGSSFLKRVFTDNELEYAKTHVNIYQHLAGRFAAKEAVFKALGEPNLAWQDVEIINDASGKPCCRFTRKKKRNAQVYISISHIKNYAVANAIVTKKTR